jgi:hypothetical protein
MPQPFQKFYETPTWFYAQVGAKLPLKSLKLSYIFKYRSCRLQQHALQTIRLEIDLIFLHPGPCHRVFIPAICNPSHRNVVLD